MAITLIIIYKIALFFLITYVVAATFYNLFFATIYFLVKETKGQNEEKLNSFAIIVPAHNEELLISHFCENMLQINYPPSLQKVFIIADNCTDETAEICGKYNVNVLNRFDSERKGKGFAIEWALEQIDLNKFNAVLILDADTTVESSILNELNVMINNGSQAIQCYIKVPNRDESWFTQLIFISRTINGLLYHHPKYKLGLSSYLMGTGMCFKSSLLQEKKWTAFTLSEDWEYFAQLVEQGIKIDFALRAVVLQQESKSLQQATTQRLRWASGRFYVVRKLGLNLLFKGISQKDLVMADASLALIFPNLSLQINLIALALICSLLLPSSAFKAVAVVTSLGLVGSLGLLLIAGIYLCGNYWAIFKAILIAPLFLVWKMVIDILCMTGLYKGKKWIRTERHIPDKNVIKD